MYICAADQFSTYVFHGVLMPILSENQSKSPSSHIVYRSIYNVEFLQPYGFERRLKGFDDFDISRLPSQTCHKSQ